MRTQAVLLLALSTLAAARAQAQSPSRAGAILKRLG
jgi:hypothetical protein